MREEGSWSNRMKSIVDHSLNQNEEEQRTEMWLPGRSLLREDGPLLDLDLDLDPHFI